MNIQHYLKLLVLASTIIFSSVAIQTSFAYGESYSDCEPGQASSIYGDSYCGGGQISSDRANNYRVANVESWDVLHVRSGAGMGYESISELPATASNIKIISNKKEVGGATWVKIQWKSQSGWVNRRYLMVMTASNTNEKSIYFDPRSIDKNIDTGGLIANKHTHPANKCVPATAHNHKGARGHFHQYKSCQQDGQQPILSAPRKTMSTHAHPANRCTSSLSHRHAGPVDHSHSYSCEDDGAGGKRQLVPQPTDYTVNRFQHTHGKSQCVNAISHFHSGGDKIHRHQCPKSSGGRNQSSYAHTHPANSLTRATTHSHPYQDRRHQHQYGY
jgi:uncharacterized protein YgiM (DUF1202 family)